jgi:hypothetical protein
VGRQGNAPRETRHEVAVVPFDAVHGTTGRLQTEASVDLGRYPKRTHLMYNDFMDEPEHAVDRGYDAICVNGHHSNGYRLMPSANRVAYDLS